jgi:hypothetical protein
LKRRKVMISFRRQMGFLGFAATLGCVVVAYGFTTSGHDAQNNTNNISVGGISGSYGYENDEGNDTWWVKGRYGYHCNGTTCAGNQASNTCDNVLKIRVTWQQGDPTTKKIDATAELTEKRGEQSSTDYDCPVGPPTWNANCTISLTPPAVGETGGTGIAGSVAQAFAHPSTPTAWIKTITDGAPYLDQSAGMSQYTWTIDPNNIDTQSKWVSAKCSVTFSGSAVEITVTKSELKALAKLTVSLSN